MNRADETCRLQSVTKRRTDLRPIITTLCNEFQAVFEARRISVDIDVPQNLWIEIDPLLVREALRKLFDNAYEAMPDGGVVTITSLVGRHGLEIEVADSGCGLSDAMEDQLFQPFTTDKRHHAGLGLTTVQSIMASHGGQVLACNCPDGGAAFTLQFPLRSARMVA